MLRSIKDLHGYTVGALDGDIGTVEQAYFDDEAWGVRYLVVETGNWLSNRPVLISPYSIKRADAELNIIPVNLTRQQVRDSPNIDTHKPVSRQYEIEYLRHYSYPNYWGGLNLWGMDALPAFNANDAATGLAPEPSARTGQPHVDPPADLHLRSTDEVKGYHIETVDGNVGHVCDFIYADEAWVIRYLCVDTHNWWPGGKEVLVATQWIALVDWFASTVSTTLTREAIRHSPAYNGKTPIPRSYEIGLHEYYGKAGYWSRDDPASSAESMRNTRR
ncbi:PRC-barrel domain-containing protein [Paraburkholderia tagetis]|uniref:PRC-barrel domain-containing protein n=1 Tax=Paraburkholderia tagetis TaxID=2913261 RepID=A0A9X1UNT9_9BURK|nr:PRC-barrel domain-containing protein [Paraburkholderia tagetis]MCG5078878.1 PRC-barrel domain-containing protein [Paraburkholderia tagetis]